LIQWTSSTKTIQIFQILHFDLIICNKTFNETTLRLEMIRFQIESIDSNSDSDFKPNRIVRQEIKSLKFRIDSISFELKPIEFDKKEYEEILLISSLSCVVNKYIYICILRTQHARTQKKNFFSWNLLSWIVAFQNSLNFAHQMKTELSYSLWS
jgi:hypothetical protein